jgi:acyl dehydratase
MKFAEFHAGQHFRLGPKRVSEAEILAFARDWDPQWFHTDPERARTGRWNGLIASGWHTGAIAMRMVVEGPLAGSESMGSPGLNYLKWRSPVRPDDELELEITVLEARPSGSGRVGVLRWRWQLFNQRGEEVLDTEATSLFELRPDAKPVTESATP